jgi:hypothetical protein
MNQQTTHNLTKALGPWIIEAMAEMKQRPDLMAELRKCMSGHGDLRIVFHVRANALTFEAVNYDEQTVAELLREYIVPADGGFALPETMTKQ